MNKKLAKLSDRLVPHDWPTFDVASYEEIIAEKVRLIAEIGSASSIRDFGGLYIVHGKYLLEGAEHLGASYAQMVDATPREAFSTAVREFLDRNPGVEVDFLQGDFRQSSLYEKLRPVDVSLLYEVLLHQENAVEVLRNVVSRTERVICIAQPCLAEDLFALPAAAVNFQFYPQELKDELREGSHWPAGEAPERFDTSKWMWGQTTSFLISCLWGLGWQLDSIKVENWKAALYWVFPLMRFVPR